MFTVEVFRNDGNGQPFITFKRTSLMVAHSDLEAHMEYNDIYKKRNAEHLCRWAKIIAPDGTVFVII